MSVRSANSVGVDEIGKNGILGLTVVVAAAKQHKVATTTITTTSNLPTLHLRHMFCLLTFCINFSYRKKKEEKK